MGTDEHMLTSTRDLSESFKAMNRQQIVLQFVNLGLIITSALMIWKTLIVSSGSESPVVVVLSGSMEPSFHRGDILVLALEDRTTLNGEIVVFSVVGRDIPIVHRVVRAHCGLLISEQKFLTKGDNNYSDDTVLYSAGQDWLQGRNVMGRSVGFLPFLGRVTILMNDYPFIKFAAIGLLGLLVITSKD